MSGFQDYAMVSLKSPKNRQMSCIDRRLFPTTNVRNKPIVSSSVLELTHAGLAIYFSCKDFEMLQMRGLATLPRTRNSVTVTYLFIRYGK